MEKMIQKEWKIGWMLKALFISYISTGVFLLILTGLLYRFDLSEKVVTVGVILIYVLSTFIGGFVIGKMAKTRRFVWGLSMGIAYFGLLLLISLAVYRTLQGDGTQILTTFALCAGGGMLGGMLS